LANQPSPPQTGKSQDCGPVMSHGVAHGPGFGLASGNQAPQFCPRSALHDKQSLIRRVKRGGLSELRPRRRFGGTADIRGAPQP